MAGPAVVLLLDTISLLTLKIEDLEGAEWPVEKVDKFADAMVTTIKAVEREAVDRFKASREYITMADEAWKYRDLNK